MAAGKRKAETLRLSDSRLEVEHGMRPMIQKMVTLPIVIDGRDSGMACYVTTSMFDQDQPSDRRLQMIAKAIAICVNGEAE